MDPPRETTSLTCIGITNQRKTILVWNTTTGVSYYNAIVWEDICTTEIVTYIANGEIDRLQSKTGLSIASYFAETKVWWLVRKLEALREDLEGGEEVLLGTIDNWLVYQLTRSLSSEGRAGNIEWIHITKMNNSS